MRGCLVRLGFLKNVEITVDCIDIQRKPRVDLCQSKQRAKLLEKIEAGAAGAYDVILLSPPCSTFSELHAQFKGHRVARSYELPRGLHKLTAAECEGCILGNIVTDFS